MATEMADLDAAERGARSHGTWSTGVTLKEPEKRPSIPEMQCQTLDLRFVRVFQVEAWRTLQDTEEDLVYHTRKVEKLTRRGASEKRLWRAKHQKRKALQRHYTFIKLANDVLGLERPSKGAMKDMAGHHRDRSLHISEPLGDPDRDEFRLIEPKRNQFEKRFIELVHPIDWTVWFRWARDKGTGDGYESGSAYSDSKIMHLAAGLFMAVICMVLMVPLVVIPYAGLSVVASLAFCFVLLLFFYAVVVRWLKGNEMALYGYAALLAAAFQVRSIN